MRVSAHREVRLTCDRKTAWSRITDTNRLNREAGLAEVEYEPLPGPGAARFRVRTWLGPLPAEFEELPFEWREPERWSVRRRVKRHLVKEIRADFTLHDGPDGGTRLDVRVELELRGPVFWPIGQAGAETTVRRLARAAQRLAGGSTGRVLPRVDRPLLARKAEALRRAVPERGAAVASLVSHLENAADEAVLRMRPYELAAQWKAERTEVLDLFLAATDQGLLELSFDLLCPSCRTATVRVPSLSDVESHAHCTLCELGFETELDRSVEATFRPAPALRRAEELRFCTGGPMMTPHVLWQAVLPERGAVSLVLPKEEGRYRLLLRGGATHPLFVRADGATEGTLTVSSEGFSGPDTWRPEARLSLEILPGGGDRHAKLEHRSFESLAVTVYELSTRPGFQRRLSGVLLKPDASLKVGRATLLFTDLRGSTAFYGRVGDAKAFRTVQDHFDLLRDIIEAHQGSVVKTIGDAIMASFPTETAGLAAALLMLERFERFLERDPELSGLGLKLGLASGPCYAVTANGALDFFGQTVNTTARIEGQAGAGELVVPVEFLEALGLSEGPEGAQVVERFSVTPKGLEHPLHLARLRAVP